MTISELIASSAQIRSKNVSGHYSMSYTFGHKQLGRPLQYNKTVLYKPNSSIVEIGLYITAVTEDGKSGHFCQVALRGVQMEAKSAEEVFAKIRSRQSGKMAQASDDELRDYIAAGNTVYNGKYVVQSRNNGNVYLVMDKNISPDTICKVRCSCASFTFDIAWYNNQHGCLIGDKPLPHPKFMLGDKTSTDTVRNMDKTPGLCKHLMLLMSMLMKDGFIQGGTDDIDGYISGAVKSTPGRISTARANYMIEQTMKQYRSQLKMTNAIAQGKYASVRQRALSGTKMGSQLTQLARTMNKIQKQINKSQSTKSLGNKIKPKSPIKKRRKK